MPRRTGSADGRPREVDRARVSVFRGAATADLAAQTDFFETLELARSTSALRTLERPAFVAVGCVLDQSGTSRLRLARSVGVSAIRVDG